jgi:F-type H+-transporting ATPase subunit alpha
MVIGIESNVCIVAILGDYTLCAVDDKVKKTNKLMGLDFNIQKTLGRVINSVGEYLTSENSNNTKLGGTVRLNLETMAPGIIDRRGVNVPIQTGIVGIDSMVPLGRGQRELIIGDKQSGKTVIAIDTILNQKFTMIANIGVICIYVSIGQRMSSITRIHNLLKKKSSMSYSIIISTVASDQASLQYLAPYTGCVIGE